MTWETFPPADKSLALTVPLDTLHNVRKFQQEVEYWDRDQSRWYSPPQHGWTHLVDLVLAGEVVTVLRVLNTVLV